MVSTEKQKREAEAFYTMALDLLNQSGANYLVGGAFAVFYYTGIYRDTKDLDVFCKFSDFNKILKFFSDKGFKTELTDVRWLGKVFKGEYNIDVIFSSTNNICKVDDSWFKYANSAKLSGIDVQFMPVEELIWEKIYVQNRERYDGADVNHLILKTGKTIDWKRLLERLDQHWHILLAQIILFQFIYPIDFQQIIPKWLFDELMLRAKEQYDMPVPVVNVCRGPILDQTQYAIDIKDWNYKVSTIMTT